MHLQMSHQIKLNVPPNVHQTTSKTSARYTYHISPTITIDNYMHACTFTGGGGSLNIFTFFLWITPYECNMINNHYASLLYVYTKDLNGKDVCSERLAELWMIQYQHCIDELQDIILQLCIVCNIQRYQRIVSIIKQLWIELLWSLFRYT